MNISWDRYIYAAVSKHLSDRSGGITTYIEGQKRGRDTEYYEVRVDDLNQEEIAKDQFLISVDISVMCNVETTRDAYRIHDLVGIIKAALAATINVYAFGGDSSYLGCLRQQGDIAVAHFGRGIKDRSLVQALASCKYTIQL